MAREATALVSKRFSIWWGTYLLIHCLCLRLLQHTGSFFQERSNTNHQRWCDPRAWSWDFWHQTLWYWAIRYILRWMRCISDAHEMIDDGQSKTPNHLCASVVSSNHYCVLEMNRRCEEYIIRFSSGKMFCYERSIVYPALGSSKGWKAV